MPSIIAEHHRVPKPEQAAAIGQRGIPETSKLISDDCVTTPRSHHALPHCLAVASFAGYVMLCMIWNRTPLPPSRDQVAISQRVAYRDIWRDI
jgi:hypothetical protein